MSITIQQIKYTHPNREILFQDISFTVNNGQKAALIGNNGSGKSTLLHIIRGHFRASFGEVRCSSLPYYVPQHFGQYNQQTIAEALHVDSKIKALYNILKGDTSISNFSILDDDWGIEEKCLSALSFWNLNHLELNQKISSLSGGEKTKVFLAGMQIHSPSIILLDEPTNHLDSASRKKLYEYIQSSRATMIIVSHDRTLLNLLPYTYELGINGITFYGGNYDFYKELKKQKENALQAELDEKEKKLRLVRKTAREVEEKKEKNNTRGKKHSEKKGISRMGMNTLKDRAEKSTTKLKEIHTNKHEELVKDIVQLRTTIPNLQQMKIDFNSSQLHTGKILISAKDINFKYTHDKYLWQFPLSFQIKSGDRIRINGNNGTGKTTLLKMIIGDLEPTEGLLSKADFSKVYIDQEYSIIKNELSIYEQIQEFNTQQMQECELKTILNRFLFPFHTWDKLCKDLSGGEKMRLVFCSLMVSNNTPDLFILDEPTNNLDIQSIEIITSSIKNYQGTVLVVSHDLVFTKEIGINDIIELS